MTNKSSFNLLGLQIDPLDHKQLLRKIDEWVFLKNTSHMVVFANAHVLMENRNNKGLNWALKRASLIIPDGMPLVVMARRRGFKLDSRPDGPGFMEKVLVEEPSNHWRHYFLGGTEDVLLRVKNHYPDILISGMYSPPFRQMTAEEDIALLANINNSKADILWVGLGCPKQEIWIAEHLDQVLIPAILGVGQAFDILAKVKTRAPEWMQKSGLEWLYRLLKEPRRLWKRYLLYNPQFVLLVIREEIQMLLGNWFNKNHQF